MPSHVNGEEDLSNLFDPLLEYIESLKHDSIITQVLLP